MTRIQSLKTIACLALLGLGTLPLSGCAALRRDYPQQKFYVLQASRSALRPPAERGGMVTWPHTVLKVRRFLVSNDYAGKNFVLRSSESGFESDFYNTFFLAPADMITNETRDWLQQAGVFEYVVGESSRLDNTHFLEGAVNAIYADYSDPENPWAVLEAQFLLINDQTIPPTPIMTKEYRASAPLADRTPEELVRGWNKALAKILTALEMEIRQLNGEEAGEAEDTGAGSEGMDMGIAESDEETEEE